MYTQESGHDVDLLYTYDGFSLSVQSMQFSPRNQDVTLTYCISTWLVYILCGGYYLNNQDMRDALSVSSSL